MALTTDKDLVEYLSRRVLRLNGKADFRRVLKELCIARYHLVRHFKAAKAAGLKQFDDFVVEQHPIMQLLTVKLTNISCPKRDTSYYQLENIVKDLAHLEE